MSRVNADAFGTVILLSPLLSVIQRSPLQEIAPFAANHFFWQRILLPIIKEVHNYGIHWF